LVAFAVIPVYRFPQLPSLAAYDPDIGRAANTTVSEAIKLPRFEAPTVEMRCRLAIGRNPMAVRACSAVSYNSHEVAGGIDAAYRAINYVAFAHTVMAIG
jgi:hypothetical protein